MHSATRVATALMLAVLGWTTVAGAGVASGNIGMGTTAAPATPRQPPATLASAGSPIHGAPALSRQVAIARVEAMPRVPSPYLMRDWRRVAADLDGLLYDFTATGPHLPLPWWDTTRVNYPWDCVGLPSFVGAYGESSGSAHQGITVMGEILGATVSGIDKSSQHGRDYVRAAQQYHNRASGENLVLNHSFDDTGHTFWYEITPQVLFTSLAHFYPRVENMDAIMAQGADRWHDASVALGGSGTTIPDFDHTAFDFDTMAAADNGAWKEPDAAAGVAFVEYMAYRKFGGAKYLEASDWAVQFLENRAVNPAYESLLPFGAYVAARLNAEEGRTYDVGRLLDWCFEPSPTRGDWGVLAGATWGGYDVSGLSAGLTPDHGYAFAMETFSQVGALTPLVRYDNRFARAIGRYVLNAANAARLFYANALPTENQTAADWSLRYDPSSSIAYEGLRQWREKRDHAAADVATAPGLIRSGTFASTFGQNGEYEVLEESGAAGHDELVHIWQMGPVTPAPDHYLDFAGRAEDAGDGDTAFTFAYGPRQDGPWTTAFTVLPTAGDTWASAPIGVHAGDLYVKVTGADTTPGNAAPDRLYVDLLHVQSFPQTTPFAMGDAVNHGWAATDLGVYGSSFVGLLGGIVRTTDVTHVLQLDLLATDYFHPAAYPTYLYYNPHLAAETVTIDVGPAPVDLYDAVSETFLVRTATGATPFTVPADAAIVVTLVPSGAVWQLEGRRLSAGGTIVDFDAESNPGAETRPPGKAWMPVAWR
jgi:hypothetical protein